MDTQRRSSNPTFNITTTESIRRTMQLHEGIFKQQVRELHRLYSVQKMLMMKNNKQTPSRLCSWIQLTTTTATSSSPSYSYPLLLLDHHHTANHLLTSAANQTTLPLDQFRIISSDSTNKISSSATLDKEEEQVLVAGGHERSMMINNNDTASISRSMEEEEEEEEEEVELTLSIGGQMGVDQRKKKKPTTDQIISFNSSLSIELGSSDRARPVPDNNSGSTETTSDKHMERPKKRPFWLN